MRTPRTLDADLVYEYAIAYVGALESLRNADTREFAEYQGQVSMAQHDLVLAVNGECGMCDPGTCPGFLD